MQDLSWLYALCATCFMIIVIRFVTGLFSRDNILRKQRPPCPWWRLPVIGHLHILKKPLHRTFQTLASQYGPVFGVQMGSQYTIIVTSPAAVEECFCKNDVVLADRPHMLTSKHLNYDSTTIVASNYNDHWRYVRRMAYQELFSASRLNMFQSLRQEEVKSMIMSLFHLTREGKKMVEMKSRISTLAFNIVVQIVTGKTYYGEDAEHSDEALKFQKLVRKIFELIATSDLGDLIPFVRLIGFRALEKKMVKLKMKADEVLQNLINETKTKGCAGRLVDSMLSNILSLQETGSASVSDNTIKGLMLVLITAGTEPTANTIEWVISNLLNKPKLLKKARLEINEMVKPSGRLVGEHDLPKLKYLHAIVKETQRLYPVAPLLAPHYSSGECTIQGFRVPVGTMIFANVWAVQRDPEVWEDPLSFKPERFEEMEKNDNNNNGVYKLVPFGIGRRSCPGANMANKVVMLALASLIQCFEWERIADEEVDMRESDGLDMCKLVPLEAMCQPRTSMIDVLSNL